jgi:hypothetical protein
MMPAFPGHGYKTKLVFFHKATEQRLKLMTFHTHTHQIIKQKSKTNALHLLYSKKKTAIAVLSKAVPTNRRNVTRATENACLHHIKLSSTSLHLLSLSSPKTENSRNTTTRNLSEKPNFVKH